MQLTNLKIRNLLGIKQAEIVTPNPIVFISGSNGAGKSSVQNIVASAINDELHRIKIKKDAQELVHCDNKEGSASIVFDQGEWALNIKNKNLTRIANSSGAHDEVLPYVTNAHKFVEDTLPDRRRLLLKLSRVKVSKDVIAQKMAARGIDAAYIDSITPFLFAGFDEALKEAQSYAREAKTIWKTITNEAYGEVKAETWQAKAEGNLEEIQNALAANKNELSAIDADLERANQQYGAIKSQRDKAAALNADITRLRTQAEKLSRIKAKLEIDKTELAQWQAKVEQARMATHGVTDEDVACQCPSCGSELVFIATERKLISRPGDLHGDEDAAVKLPEYERTLELFANSVKNGGRDLAAAEMAQAQLSALEARNESTPDEAAVQQIIAKLDELKSTKKKLEQTISNLVNEEKALKEADNNTAKARTHHNQVIGWSKVIDALSPEGIPNELLTDAMKPVNDRLAMTAQMAGWAVPHIDNNMLITANKRPYQLLSESEQWRVDCLIAEAISYLSGIKFYAIDRFDVLDGSGRAQLFTLLEELAAVDAIETVLVTGTLKREQATSIAENFDYLSAYWIEQGELSEVA